jgi:excisionase family DNA binding protein
MVSSVSFVPIPWKMNAQRNVMNAERWLSVQEIAAHLGVKTDTVYTWVSKKHMPAHKVGRLWKFKVSEVDSWVHSGNAGKAGKE